MPDVDARLYTTVIREVIRHENDVTNHRIMWLLIVQGLIANAFATGGRVSGENPSALAVLGILVTLSAFVILYKSYQARGYLQFLGGEAKKGTLRDEDLPLIGWPDRRIRGWRKRVWCCPWIGRVAELLEPFFFLPSLLVLAWLYVLLRQWLSLRPGILLTLCTVLTGVMIASLSVLWVWWHEREEQ